MLGGPKKDKIRALGVTMLLVSSPPAFPKEGGGPQTKGDKIRSQNVR